jgi:hypothetical protein
MKAMTPLLLARLLLLVEGVYFLMTGVWPLVHLESFLAVTGPKRDLWLVQTVGALLGVMGLTMLLGAWRRAGAEAIFLAVAAAATLATVDVVFVARRAIGPIYLLDALAELLLLAAWVGVGIALRQAHVQTPRAGKEKFAGHLAIVPTGR